MLYFNSSAEKKGFEELILIVIFELSAQSSTVDIF